MALTTNQLVVGMFNMAAGGFKTLVGDYMTARGATATADTLLPVSGLNPQFMGTNLYSNADFATNLVGRVLSGVATGVQSSISTIVANYMNANPTMSRGSVIVAVLEAVLAVPTTDATLGSAVSAFTAKVALADASTSTSTDFTTLTAIVGGTATTVGTTYTLTTGTDTVPGTTGDDTINGGMDDNTDANRTLTVLDTVNGGAGTDTLNIALDTSAGALSFPGASVSNIEIFNFRNISGQTLTVDTSLVAGETTMASDRSTNQVDFTNVAAGTAIGVIGNTSVANGATNATYVAAATAGLLNVSSGTTAGAIAIDGAGFTSLTINSTSATNTVGAVSSSGTKIATTTINATTAFETSGLTVGTVAAGGQTLVISGAAGDRAATSTAAAKSAVTLGALDADYASVNASGLTAGGVSATLSATVAATFTGGAGADRVSTSTTGQTGAVDAGSGTDILVLTDSADIDSTAEGAIYKNFEVLHSDDAAAAVSIDMDLITGSTITAIMVTDAANGTSVTDMNSTQAAAVTVLAGNGAMTLGVKNASTVGTLNTMNITVSDGDTTGSEAAWAAGDLTMAGVETVNITATDDVTWATMANITGLTALTVTGDGDVAVTTGAHVVTANESVNFSALTAASTFNFAAATTNALAFTGGSGIDTVTDSVTGGNVIVTGAGRDVITLTGKTGGSSGTSVTAGAGGDSIVATGQGNAAIEKITLVYAAGDSVCDSSVASTGFVATKMDAITAIDFANAAGAADGHYITFDTVESATAQTWASTAVTFGTTAVTNAYDFYIYNTGAGGITYVYQDTDGDKLIETGEFAVQLTGIGATATASAEFTISSGNLILSTTAG